MTGSANTIPRPVMSIRISNLSESTKENFSDRLSDEKQQAFNGLTCSNKIL